MACRSGCKTKDHESYSACLREGAPRVLYSNSAKNFDMTREKKWNAELDAYRGAVAEGIQPATTKMRDIQEAKRISDKTGQPFRADA